MEEASAQRFSEEAVAEVSSYAMVYTERKPGVGA
jgi:hypothetical protein